MFRRSFFSATKYVNDVAAATVSLSSSPLPLLPVIDLRSDTITRPTPAMMEFVKSCFDDVKSGKNLVAQLEREAAAMVGKEDAVFVPSGTMSNLVALMTHSALSTRRHHHHQPEAIIGSMSHIHLWEAGGLASVGRIYPRQVQNETSSGQIPLNDLKRNVANNTADSHRAVTVAVALENTCGDNGGKVLPLSYIRAVRGMLDIANGADTAFRVGLHCDGARLWNAAHHAAPSCGGDHERAIRELAQPFDSASLCLSKGLGAPVGSILVGNGEFVRLAREEVAPSVGGGISKASSSKPDEYASIAAAGLYALRNNFARMRHDHENATTLADGLREAGFVVQPVDTNIVVWNVRTGRASEFVKVLSDRTGGNVKVMEMDESSIRGVLHLHIERKEVEELCRFMKVDEVMKTFC